jgi:hypothetical protein
MANDDPFGTVRTNVPVDLKAALEKAKQESAKKQPPAPAAKPAPPPAAKPAPAPAKPAATAPPAPAPAPAPAAAPQPPAAKTEAPAPAALPAQVIDTKAVDVCKLFKLSDPAGPLLTDGQTLGTFVQLLMEKKLPQDAVQVLAHGLPKRPGVWWACWGCRQVFGEKPAVEVAAALEAAEKWAAEPSDSHREAVRPAAEAVGLSTPAGCAAMAAYFSGGSLAPAEAKPVSPPETLTAQMVAAALFLASAADRPRANERLAAFVDEGLRIARDLSRWK